MERIVSLCQQWIRILSEHILSCYQIWEDISAGLIASWDARPREAEQAVSPWCSPSQGDESRGRVRMGDKCMNSALCPGTASCCAFCFHFSLHLFPMQQSLHGVDLVLYHA